MIPAYFDYVLDPTRKTMFNGFSKETYHTMLSKSTNSIECEQFKSGSFDFSMRLFVDLPLCNTFKLVGADYPNEFIYPIQIHWWMQQYSAPSWSWADLTIPNDVIIAITQKRCRIVLYNCFEGWELSWWSTVIKSIQSSYPILQDQDFVITSNNVAVAANNIPIVNSQSYQKSGPYQNFTIYKDVVSNRIANKATRQYKFLCMNRRPSNSRWATVTKLFNDRHQGLLSYACDTTTGMTVTDNTVNFDTTGFERQFPSIYAECKQVKLLDHMPFVIPDGVDVRTNPTKDNSVFKFTDSYLHIVTETYFNYATDHIHLSEKIFKPIWFMQPFVVIAPPYTLVALRKLGYNTFGNWIDESYDQEINDHVRMEKSIQSSKDFYNNCNQTLSEIMLDMLPTLVHNIDVIQDNANTKNSNLRLQHYMKQVFS